MKKYLLFLILILPSIVFAQNIEKPDLKPSYQLTSESEYEEHKQKTLEGCWGIPFGTRRDSVIKIIKKRIGKVPSLGSQKDVLSYSQCEFGGEVADINLLFTNELFYGSWIKIIPDRHPLILTVYESVKRDISKKYFTPHVEVETYKYPYEKGDGHELTAIRLGYATIGAIWDFEKSAKTYGKGKIILSVRPDGSVNINYRDGFLSLEEVEDLKKKTLSDY